VIAPVPFPVRGKLLLQTTPYVSEGRCYNGEFVEFVRERERRILHPNLCSSIYRYLIHLRMAANLR
jgi:hypothetical protein